MCSVGAGGFWGRGLGNGTQTQLNFLRVQHTDFIVVLAEGRIVERGSHGDLLSADGLYRRLYNLQFRT